MTIRPSTTGHQRSPDRRGGSATDAESNRPLWLAIMLLTSAILGGAASVLWWAGGDNPFVAVLKGAGAAGATILLLLAIYHFLNGSRRR